MPFVPGHNVAEIRINQTLFAQQVQNTLYALDFAGWDATKLSVLGGEIVTWVGTELYPNLSSALSLTEVAIRDLTIQDGPFTITTPTVAVTGGSTSPALPGNVAACVSFRSSLTGRSRRGRNYVAGIPETQVAGNILDPAFVAALKAAYEVFFLPTGPFGATGSAWAVFSRYANNEVRPLGQPTLISSVQVDPFVDSQRRRLNGRGI